MSYEPPPEEKIMEFGIGCPVLLVLLLIGVALVLRTQRDHCRQIEATIEAPDGNRRVGLVLDDGCGGATVGWSYELYVTRSPSLDVNGLIRDPVVWSSSEAPCSISWEGRDLVVHIAREARVEGSWFSSSKARTVVDPGCEPFLRSLN